MARQTRAGPAIVARWSASQGKPLTSINGATVITVCHPVDDMEVLFFKMELVAEGIPHLVVGQHFGSLYPGLQVPWYNERSIQVPLENFHQAEEVIRRVRAYYEPSFVNLTKKSKLRILCETVLCGWFMPAGSKRSSNVMVEEVGASPQDGSQSAP